MNPLISRPSFFSTRWLRVAAIGVITLIISDPVAPTVAAPSLSTSSTDILQAEMSVDLTQASIRDYQVMKFRILYNCVSTTTDAQGATMTDILDPNLEVVGLIGSVHTTGSNYNASTNTVTFTFKGPLPAGSSGEVFIQARFKGTTPEGTLITNNATFSASNATSKVTNSVTVKGINAVVGGGGSGSLVFAKGMYLDKEDQNGNWYNNMSGWITWYIKHGNTGATGESLTNYTLQDTFPVGHRLEWLSSDQFPGTSNPVTVEYKTNKVPGWRVWGAPLYKTGDSTSYFFPGNLGLPSDEYVNGLRWKYGTLPGGGLFHPDSQANGIRFQTRLIDPLTGPAAGTKVQNCANQSSTELGAKSECDDVTVSAPGPDFGAWHWVSSGGSPFDWEETLTMGAQMGVNPASDTALTNPSFGILLPKGISYAGPWRIEGWGWEQAGSVAPNFVHLPNYRNSGRTMVRWSWSGASGNPMTLPVNRGSNYFYIYFDVKVAKFLPNGYYQSDMYSNWENPAEKGFGWWEVDTGDWDGDGNLAEKVARDYCNIFVQTLGGSAGLDSVMWVKGELDSDWTKYPSKGETTPGGKADYEVRVSNPSGVVMQDLVMIDVLPAIGDTGVIDTSARGSEWSPYLAAPVAASGATVYYSKSKNPCRDELTPGLPVGCEAPNWTSTPPSDLTTVRSLKIDYTGTLIYPGDEKVISWPMRAPVNAPTAGQIAWNSFGYIARRTDDGRQLLASEPVKTGIAIRPPLPPFYGDFVWNDSNKNGLQDSGEAGVNGVRIELYRDNGDGVTDPSTDTLAAFTITSNDGTRDGAYLFGNIGVGSYYAVVLVPSIWGISPKDMGADDLDSDGNATILRGQRAAIMPITQLIALEEDRTWDQGLYDRSGVPSVWAVVNMDDGRVLLGGRFASSHGVPRNNIARLNADGTVDSTFDPGTGFNEEVRALALRSDGKILVGGYFDSYNGQPAPGLALLTPTGAIAATLPAPDRATIRWVSVTSAGMYFAGLFNKVGGVPRGCIARLTAEGALDSNFNSSSGANEIINAGEVQPDGKIIIVGNFTSYGGSSRGRVARLNSDGSLDSNFNVGSGANGEIFAIKLLEDGRMVLTGSFTEFSGKKCTGAIRLLADGSCDPTISPSALTVDSIQSTN